MRRFPLGKRGVLAGETFDLAAHECEFHQQVTGSRQHRNKEEEQNQETIAGGVRLPGESAFRRRLAPGGVGTGFRCFGLLGQTGIPRGSGPPLPKMSGERLDHDIRFRAAGIDDRTEAGLRRQFRHASGRCSH